ncbi:hypothetical protein VNO78_00143 [Psophocarpus tetragonolobus]|uniref:BZIP domain-containing protein n=1 Tax=Psophocarpus tetragonolobus TaxID=3891 RepID=A0AAN9SZ17_PSOTE
MYPILSEIFFSGCMINSTVRRRTHLVQSFSVVFLYWLYYICQVSGLGPACAWVFVVFSKCMACSSGSGSGSGRCSGSEEELQALMEERKRKRMISNRESARRSRMRKQKHLDELGTVVTKLRNENQQIVTSLNLTTQKYLAVEAENSVLRAQVDELRRRLESLNEIINLFDATNAASFGPPFDGTSFFNTALGYHFSDDFARHLSPLHQMGSVGLFSGF